eukprot:100191-Pelagomonas_calceolata.AAC.3
MPALDSSSLVGQARLWICFEKAASCYFGFRPVMIRNRHWPFALYRVSRYRGPPCNAIADL